MLKYIMKRLLLAIPTLLGVITLLFFVIRLAPGDPVLYILGDMATSERVAALRKELGLDKPLIVQYIEFMSKALRGDFGRSFSNGMPAMERVLKSFPYTLQLAVLGTLIAIVLGLGIGIMAAINRNSWIDLISTTAVILIASMPIFWLAILLIDSLSVQLGIFPVQGVGDPENPFSVLWHLLLPAITLGLGMSATIARMTRSSLLEVLNEDYVRTAWSKGASKYVVIFEHALRNALIPVVTIIGLNFGYLLGGTVLLETVFSRPGLGTLLIEAVYARDYPQIQASVFFFSLVFIMVNIGVDILYSFLDPRIKLR